MLDREGCMVYIHSINSVSSQNRIHQQNIIKKMNKVGSFGRLSKAKFWSAEYVGVSPRTTSASKTCWQIFFSSEHSGRFSFHKTCWQIFFSSKHVRRFSFSSKHSGRFSFNKTCWQIFFLLNMLVDFLFIQLSEGNNDNEKLTRAQTRCQSN